MLRQHAVHFVQITYLLEAMNRNLIKEPTSPVLHEIRSSGDIAEWWDKYFQDLSLPSSSRQLAKIRKTLAEPVDDVRFYAYRLSCEIEELHNRLLEELMDRYFYYLEPEKAKVYIESLNGWENVASTFPDTKTEIIEAQQCLGLSRSTAAVFHAMRVLEHGLRSLAAHLNVDMASLRNNTWETILTNIEGAIKRAQENPNGAKLTSAEVAERKKTYQSYVPFLVHFKHIKDAWRNHVMHGDVSYNDAAAEGIIRGVCAFMNELASLMSVEAT